MAQAQSRVCQLSRESYLAVYRDLYVQAIDRQIYPITKPLQKIIPPSLDTGFQSQICSGISLTPTEVRAVQAEVYAYYFGADDYSHPVRAKLREFLVHEARSSEALQTYEIVDRVRMIVRHENLTDEQKYQQLMQYMNGMSQPQLRLYLDSSRDLFAFLADSELQIDAYLQNLKRAYPSAEELVQHLSRFSLMSDEEYSAPGAQQMRTQLAKSLQSVRMSAKMACTVSLLAAHSLTLHRTGIEYSELVDTLFTLFPETEKYWETVCNDRDASSPTVKSLRKSYLQDLEHREPKPKRLKLVRLESATGVPEATASKKAASGPVSFVRCLEGELLKQFESEMRQAHPQARYMFGFNDSRGCGYSFDIEPQRIEKGKIKVRYRLRVSHPSFLVSDTGDTQVENLASDVLEKIRKLGVQLESSSALKK